MAKSTQFIEFVEEIEIPHEQGTREGTSEAPEQPQQDQALLKKLEKKAKAAEHKKSLKRKYLLREIKYGGITLKNHEKKWRQMLIDISTPILRNDMEYAWQSFERIVDCKDFIISLLMDELKDSEEQYMLNINNHVDNVEKLMRMFHYHIKLIDEENTKKIKSFYSEHNKELTMLRAAGVGDEYLKTMLFGLEVARKKQEQYIQIEYFSKLNAEESSNTNDIQRLRAVLESRHNKLWENTLDFLDNYQKKTTERKLKHDELKAIDDGMQALLAMQLRKLQHSYNCIKRLKEKLSNSHKYWDEKLALLKKQHDYFDHAFISLKNKLIKDRALDMHQMTILTADYNDAVGYLRTVHKKAEHILHLMSVCRKLQTLEEKVLPFPVASNDGILLYSVSMISSMMDLSDAEGNSVLNLFWQQVGQAEASKISIQDELNFLKRENAELKLQLHNYCQCVDCPVEKHVNVITHFNITDCSSEMNKYKKQQFNVDVSKPESESIPE